MAKPTKLKSGMYRYRIRVKHPLTGKWLERSTTQSTMKLCYEWEIEIRSTFETTLQGKTEIGPYFDLWFETYKKNNVGPDHVNKIKATKKKVLKYFGENVKFEDLSKIKYQSWINDLAEKGLSKETIRDYHNIFRAVLIDAMDNEILNSLPCRNIRLVGRDASEDRKKTLNLAEWKKLLETILEAPFSSSKYAAITMMFTGARFQEVDGLQIPDVVFSEKKITITKAFDYKRTKALTSTKNKKSVRDVDMPDILVTLLAGYIKTLRHQGNIISLDSSKFLFPNKVGNPITNASINKFITKQCKKADIGRITSHAFRHAKTDLLVLAGADMIYTQRQLGHADASTTLRYYSSLSQEIREKNNNIQNNFMNDNVIKKHG